MIKLERGAPVRVRLHTGEVVEAVYDSPRVSWYCDGVHWVIANGSLFFALNKELIQSRRITGLLDDECIFVGPPCVLGAAGVSDE